MASISLLTSVLFAAAVVLTVGIFLSAVRKADSSSFSTKFVIFIIPFWMMFQAILGIGGFYRDFGSFPPRIVIFGVLPAVVVLVSLLAYAKESLVYRLPIPTLTILHAIRLPVEYVLHRLYVEGAVPVQMTYEGHNFDILSGISAVVVYLIAFKGGATKRSLLIVWNLGALLLLAVIVTTAALAVPSPIQTIAFDRPNVGILYFPFIWLPTIVVPIVLFCHLASLAKLISGRTA
ncbi:MAG TPA: hypothetical protein PKD11_11540 [Pyrinomonadaceae bacterium]|mgnify:CR=1 FL=1|nr:hypothetical protein [Pyrinomonadaceae bacterium]